MLDSAAPPRTALDSEMRQVGSATDALFAEHLPLPADGSRRLVEAMRYAAMGGGKRLRPLLVIGAARLFGVPRGRALRAGLAVECVHVHSLIHDDLPCMDDDDLRRGRPTVHRAFDEATALLAGDALHALAFEILAAPDTHPDAEVRCALASGLARAAGARGMAGGQMLDLAAERDPAIDLAAVTRLQQLKTGALIAWSIDAGAVLAGAGPNARVALRGYADCLGLAFQIVDDLIDAEGNEQAAGKRVGKDAARGKQSFVSLLGVREARARAEALCARAVEHLAGLGDAATLLCEVAHYVADRDR